MSATLILTNNAITETWSVSNKSDSWATVEADGGSITRELGSPSPVTSSTVTYTSDGSTQTVHLGTWVTKVGTAEAVSIPAGAKFGVNDIHGWESAGQLNATLFVKISVVTESVGVLSFDRTLVGWTELDFKGDARELGGSSGSAYPMGGLNTNGFVNFLTSAATTLAVGERIAIEFGSSTVGRNNDTINLEYGASSNIEDDAGLTAGVAGTGPYGSCIVLPLTFTTANQDQWGPHAEYEIPWVSGTDTIAWADVGTDYTAAKWETTGAARYVTRGDGGEVTAQFWIFQDDDYLYLATNNIIDGCIQPSDHHEILLCPNTDWQDGLETTNGDWLFRRAITSSTSLSHDPDFPVLNDKTTDFNEYLLQGDPAATFPENWELPSYDAPSKTHTFTSNSKVWVEGTDFRLGGPGATSAAPNPGGSSSGTYSEFKIKKSTLGSWDGYSQLGIMINLQCDVQGNGHNMFPSSLGQQVDKADWFFCGGLYTIGDQKTAANQVTVETMDLRPIMSAHGHAEAVGAAMAATPSGTATTSATLTVPGPKLWIVDTDANGAGAWPAYDAYYTSLQAAQAAAYDLVAAAESLIIDCSGATADTTSAFLVGWTTSAIYDLTIRQYSGDRHDGFWSTSKYRLIPDISVYGQGVIELSPGADHVTLDGLQIGGNQTTTEAIDQVNIKNNSAWEHTVKNCIIKGTEAGTGTNVDVICTHATTAQGTCHVYNNILYSPPSASTQGACVYGNSRIWNIYNNIFVCQDPGSTKLYGIYNVGTASLVKNNIFIGFTGSRSTNAITVAAGSGYNATTDTTLNYTVTGGATGDLLSQVDTDLLVDPDNDDFTLKTGSNAIDAGTDLSGIFLTDLAGTTRDGWDMGAITYSVPASASCSLSATSSAALTTEITLAGAGNGNATTSAALTNEITLAGAGNADATSSAAIITSIAAAASCSSSATTSAALTTEIAAKAAVTGSATASSTLTVPAAVGDMLRNSQTVVEVLSQGSKLRNSQTVIEVMSFLAPALLQSAVSGAATLAGGLTSSIAAAAACTGSASTSAALTSEITATAVVTAATAVTADLTNTITAAADCTCSATSSAALTSEITLAGQPSATAVAIAAGLTETGAVSLFAASVSGAGSASGSITSSITATAVCTGSASTVADLTHSITAAADCTAGIGCSAALTSEITAAASCTGSASSSAALTSEITAATACSGNASATAALTSEITLAGQPSATAVAVAAGLTETGAVSLFAASVSGAGSASGSITSSITATAVCTGSASTVADLTHSITAAADCTAGISCSASLDTQIQLTAPLSATAACSAELQIQADLLQAAATVESTATGGLTTGISLNASISTSASTSADLATSIALQILLLAEASASAALSSTPDLFQASTTAGSTATAGLSTGITLNADLNASASANGQLWGATRGKANMDLRSLTIERSLESLTAGRMLVSETAARDYSS